MNIDIKTGKLSLLAIIAGAIAITPTMAADSDELTTQVIEKNGKTIKITSNKNFSEAEIEKLLEKYVDARHELVKTEKEISKIRIDIDGDIAAALKDVKISKEQREEIRKELEEAITQIRKAIEEIRKQDLS